MRKTLTRGEAIDMLLADPKNGWDYEGRTREGAETIVDEILIYEDINNIEVDLVEVMEEYTEMDLCEISIDFGHLLDLSKYDYSGGLDQYFEDLVSEIEKRTEVFEVGGNRYIIKSFGK